MVLSVLFTECSERKEQEMLMNLPFHLVQPMLLHYCNEKHIRICLDT